MTFGYAVTAVVVTVLLGLGVRPLGRSGWRARVSWLGSLLTAEAPFLPFAALALTTALEARAGDLHGAGLGLALVLLALAGAAATVIAARSLRARSVLARAMDAELGTGADGRQAWDRAEPRLRRRLRWLRILLAPLPLTVPPDLVRTADVSYGPDGRWNRLDVYRHRRRPLAGPVLVHLHGGGFTGGRKSFEARPLLHRLARRGWLVVSADYRRLPLASFAGMTDDVQRALGWARQHAAQAGADPDLVFLAGSSAGAHLAVTTALAELDGDGPVAGVIGLYGYYGAAAIGSGVPSVAGGGPTARRPVGTGQPFPALIAHGDQDTFVSPANARAAVDRLRRTTTGPVVHVELPGAQHSFDLLHSLRFEILMNGIEAFAQWVVALRGDRRRSRP